MLKYFNELAEVEEDLDDLELANPDDSIMLAQVDTEVDKRKKKKKKKKKRRKKAAAERAELKSKAITP
jgi:hypothetical protein